MAGINQFVIEAAWCDPWLQQMRLSEDISEAAIYLASQTPETLTGGMVSAPDYDHEHGIPWATAYERLHT